MTVHQAFQASARRWPGQPFLCVLPETAAIYGIDAGELRYEQAAQAVDTLRAAYARAGYGHGHRAGLLLENRPAFFLHWFALNALGVSVVPINPDLRAAELEYLAGHSEIALAVALPGRHADLLAAAERAGRTLRVMVRTKRRLPPRSRRRWPANRMSTANAPCSTPPAPPDGPRAASCPTGISCMPATGMPASAGWRRWPRDANACSRPCPWST